MESKIDILHKLQAGDFAAYLKTLTNESHVFNKIYLSFGSKFNEPYVNLKTHDDSPWFSNALDQMCPSFIRYRPDEAIENILVIIIDDFRNNKLLNQNMLLLGQELETLTHTRICLLDNLCNVKSLKEIMKNIIEFAEMYNVENNNFMVCNFVKYMNLPNIREESNMRLITNHVSYILKKHDRYYDCLYEWFGYCDGLHTMVYNYNNLVDKPYFKHSLRILQQIIHSKSNGLPIHFMKEFSTSNLHVYELMKGICSLEICHDKPYHMNISLYDFMRLTNIIKDSMRENII